MKNKVKVSIQLLPASRNINPDNIIESVTEIIKKSGVFYNVNSFDINLEGNFDQIMDLIKEIHEKTLDVGAESIVSFIKIQIRKDSNVSLKEKTIKLALEK